RRTGAAAPYARPRARAGPARCARGSANRASFAAPLRSSRPIELHVAESLPARVVGEIDVNRRDRDHSCGDGGEVRAFLFPSLDFVAADPVVGAPSRVDVLGDRIAVTSAALTSEPEAPGLLALRRLGDVDVEQRVRRQ